MTPTDYHAELVDTEFLIKRELNIQDTKKQSRTKKYFVLLRVLMRLSGETLRNTLLAQYRFF